MTEIPITKTGFEFCKLEFRIYLGFGNWNLGFKVLCQ